MFRKKNKKDSEKTKFSENLENPPIERKTTKNYI